MSKAIVVDDSRAVRLIIAKVLGELGFEVVQAANGREAVDVMTREGASVTFALVDWNMPEMTGIEFVRWMRTKPSYNDIRLLMVTTETEMDQIAAALDAGANEYMMKPFTREVMEDKLRLLGVIE